MTAAKCAKHLHAMGQRLYCMELTDLTRCGPRHGKQVWHLCQAPQCSNVVGVLKQLQLLQHGQCPVSQLNIKQQYDLTLGHDKDAKGMYLSSSFCWASTAASI